MHKLREMNLSIFLLITTWKLFSRITLSSAVSESNQEKCPFKHTVNLTNLPSYENGSVLYQGILIPADEQQFYNYDLKFLSYNKSVPSHLRGCVCNQRPCIKLCCAQDEYWHESGNTTKCEKLTEDMNVSWDLPIQFDNGKILKTNIFKRFIYQVGVPCKKPEALFLEDNAILMENGNLFSRVDNMELTTQDYCCSPHLDTKSGLYLLTPFDCDMDGEYYWQLQLNIYAIVISLVFLIPTIVVYLTLKELRGSLSGKLLICYLLSMTISNGIIAFINISNIRFGVFTCSLLGFGLYFFSMAAFLWLSVIAFDMLKNFKDTSVEIDHRRNMRPFLIYSLYAWMSAGMATAFAFYMQNSPNVNDNYKPDIGDMICALNSEKWSAAIYFYGPNLIILLFNLITFVHLTATIYKIRRDLAKMTQKEKFFKDDAAVICRLFLLMGISWIFEVLSYYLRDFENFYFMFPLSDIFNAILAISIFSFFVLKPRVLNLLRNRFRN